MDSRIFITGAGIISALGIGKDSTLEALRECRSGVGSVRLLNSRLPELPVGEVKFPNEELSSMLGIPSGTPTNRTSLLGMAALKEALAQASLSPEDLAEASLVSGTTVGGMDMSERWYRDYISPGSDEHTEYLKIHDCGAVTDAVADWSGGFKFSMTLSTACSSAANAVITGVNLIRSGRASIVAAGGSECLSNFHLCGFNTLMICDSSPCRPFDAGRAGLNLGEGAAYLILESEESAFRRGVQPLAEMAGYGNACDAYHQTAASPEGEGAFRAMSAAIRMAGITPSDIDYVNAHGTGTLNNDLAESAALRRVFGTDLPPVSSTKAFTGHTTSASGSIEAVICLLAMEHSFIPVNLNWTSPSEGCIVPFTGVGKRVEARIAMTNSFGFGGNDTSLILRKI